MQNLGSLEWWWAKGEENEKDDDLLMPAIFDCVSCERKCVAFERK